MATLVIKNLPEPLHDKLRAQAARNHRSMTKEAVSLIEIGVNARPGRAAALSPTEAKGARGLSYEELEAALTDNRYAHYQSMDEVVDYVRGLRTGRDEPAR